jgi:hypothetical protein
MALLVFPITAVFGIAALSFLSLLPFAVKTLLAFFRRFKAVAPRILRNHGLKFGLPLRLGFCLSPFRRSPSFSFSPQLGKV